MKKLLLTTALVGMTAGAAQRAEAASIADAVASTKGRPPVWKVRPDSSVPASRPPALAM